MNDDNLPSKRLKSKHFIKKMPFAEGKNGYFDNKMPSEEGKNRYFGIKIPFLITLEEAGVNRREKWPENRQIRWPKNRRQGDKCRNLPPIAVRNVIGNGSFHFYGGREGVVWLG